MDKVSSRLYFKLPIQFMFFKNKEMKMTSLRTLPVYREPAEKP